MTTKADVHVFPAEAAQADRWRLSVNGADFGDWPQCRAVRLALKAARALSGTPQASARVVIHNRDGSVRSVLSFGEGRPMRLRRRREAGKEVRLPVALVARFARDLAHPLV